MKLHYIRFLASAAIALGFVTVAYAQNSLPINAAASVNGMIISNDAVEEGIQAALSQGQKEILQKLYYDIDLVFNDKTAELHLFTLNYYNENNLSGVLEKIKGKQMLFYYQNQNYHETNEQKDNELQYQLNKYLSVIGKHTGYSWWTYIRHFIIKS